MKKQTHKHLKVEAADHSEVKSLASKAGISIIDFVKVLIKAYKGKSK